MSWFQRNNRCLRRGVFTSVADLSAAITTWPEHWNTDPKPFIWKATAHDIITKVQRGRDTCARSRRRRTTSRSGTAWGTDSMPVRNARSRATASMPNTPGARTGSACNPSLSTTRSSILQSRRSVYKPRRRSPDGNGMTRNRVTSALVRATTQDAARLSVLDHPNRSSCGTTRFYQLCQRRGAPFVRTWG